MAHQPSGAGKGLWAGNHPGSFQRGSRFQPGHRPGNSWEGPGTSLVAGDAGRSPQRAGRCAAGPGPLARTGRDADPTFDPPPARVSSLSLTRSSLGTAAAASSAGMAGKAGRMDWWQQLELGLWGAREQKTYVRPCRATCRGVPPFVRHTSATEKRPAPLGA